MRAVPIMRVNHSRGPKGLIVISSGRAGETNLWLNTSHQGHLCGQKMAER